MVKKTDLKKVIIYGLGHAFEEQKELINNEFNVIGYSDKIDYKIFPYVKPAQINLKEVDYIYVTSERYYEEIKKELIAYGVDRKKIITKRDVVGDFRNTQLRDEWIIKKLREIPAGKIILDAGAGERPYAKYCSHLQYLSQDFGEYKPGNLEEGLQMEKWDTSHIDIVSDIIDMPLDDNSIDVILCTEVFEHIANPLKALKEFSRILRKGGILILTAPFCSITHMAPFYYANGFSKYWYEDSLPQYGLQIDEMEIRGSFYQWIAQELNRLPEISCRYSNHQIEKEELKTITDTMKLLKRLSEQDTCSNEILCFGYMLTARKV